MGLAYPNDRDGGSLRTAGIQNLERKLAMAERDRDAKMVEKFAAQLADWRDATKSPSPSIVLVK